MTDSAQTVFVVDDDATTRTAVTRLLKAAGVQAEVFASAEEFFARPLPEQRAEHGIAVETWEAGPDDLAPGLDQRRERAVADEREIERRHAGDRINGT